MPYARWASKEEILNHTTRLNKEDEVKKSGVTFMYDDKNLYIKMSKKLVAYFSASGTTKIISNKFNGKRIEIEEQCVFDVENNEFNLTDKFNVKGIAKIVSNKLNCKN